MIGKTFGHYKIADKIGRGGMGEVYRALDTRLDRDVALKVLPEETATDPERLRRFEREAKAVAALKHPNIVTIHSVETIDGRSCLTMELVEGKTLSELIQTGGMSLDRLFDLAIPIADALSAAHAKGITHRDLKPSNIMVDNDGRVKVLDFGLAKLVAPPDSSEEKTVVDDDSVTAEGKVVGTVHYMSPEQAEAKALDHRSDLFSLGVVLYEMATGARPFSGDTPISTISAILREKPQSVTAIRSNLPRHLARVINRCLEKNPDKRFQTARDVCNELEGLKQEVESGEHDDAISGSMSQSSLGLPRQKQRPMWAIGAIVVIALAAVVYVAFFRDSAPPEGRNVTSRPMTSMVGIEIAGSWAPDGGFFAYSHSAAGPLDIFIVSSAGGDAIKLVESPYDDTNPRWSPDNRWIAFVSNRDEKSGIYLIPPLGGQVQKLVETGVAPLTGEMYGTLGANPWLADGSTLVFGKRDDEGKSGIWTIDLSSRSETRLTTPDAGYDDSAAAVSFDGDKVVFCRSNGLESLLLSVPITGGEPREIIQEDEEHLSPIWAPGDERIVYGYESGGLWLVDIKSKNKRQVTTGIPKALRSSRATADSCMGPSAIRRICTFRISMAGTQSA
jgi:serine/threonine protein kinase